MRGPFHHSRPNKRERKGRGRRINLEREGEGEGEGEEGGGGGRGGERVNVCDRMACQQFVLSLLSQCERMQRAWPCLAHS